MTIGVAELVAKLGDDNIKFQPLDQCAINFRQTKSGNHVTFVTDQPFDLEGSKEMGIVLWLPRDKVKEILG